MAPVLGGLGVFCQASSCGTVGTAKNSAVMTQGWDKIQSLSCHLGSHLLPPQWKLRGAVPTLGPGLPRERLGVQAQEQGPPGTTGHAGPRWAHLNWPASSQDGKEGSGLPGPALPRRSCPLRLSLWGHPCPEPWAGAHQAEMSIWHVLEDIQTSSTRRNWK